MCDLERAYAVHVAAEAYYIPYGDLRLETQEISVKRENIKEDYMDDRSASCWRKRASSCVAVMREMTNEQTGEVPRCTRAKSAQCKLATGKAHQQVQEQCPICCESVDADDLFTNEANAGPYMASCHCYACAKCIVKWVNTQLPACRANKLLRVQCYGCHKTMPQKLVLMNEAAVALATALERREVLQRNDLFPACMQVECRRIECVGIGYLGHETIMCMVCEEQWNASEDTVTHVGANTIDASELVKLGTGEFANLKVAEQLTITVRKCPNCGVITEKNGGCDHMSCGRCKHEYYWSTGKKYR